MSPTFELRSLDIGSGPLHGLLAKPSRPRGLVLHLHGTWGNFYANPFIVPLSGMYVDAGYAFLTANLPGHDETAVTENFRDSASAITNWISAVDVEGPVILQGHSLGALKALDYAARCTAKPDRLVLLSPFDVIAFYSGKKPERLANILAELDRIVTNDGPKALVPKAIFDMWDISAATLRDLMTPGGAADCFPSRFGIKDQMWTQLGIPILACVGGDDFAAYPSPRDVVSTLNSVSPNISAKLIEGAPHNFAGRVEALADEVRKWIS